jgi:hypothetical protein
MARQIEQAIKYNGNVICNSEIELPEKLKKKKSRKLFCVENEQITPEFLYSFARKHHKPRRESQTLVVIDECQLKFSDTFMTKATARPWLKFFSQHRKLGYDFLMVTPSIRTGLVRDIREIVEVEVGHWKMTNYPTKGVFSGLILLIIQLLPINLFMSVTQWRAMPDKKNLIRRLFLYKPRYAKMYDTYKIYDMDEPGRGRQQPATGLPTVERGGGDTACGGDPPRSTDGEDTAEANATHYYTQRDLISADGQNELQKGSDSA